MLLLHIYRGAFSSNVPVVRFTAWPTSDYLMCRTHSTLHGNQPNVCPSTLSNILPKSVTWCCSAWVLLTEIVYEAGCPHEMTREIGAAMEQIIREYVAEIEARGGGTTGHA
jgi:hypothetical protein